MAREIKFRAWGDFCKKMHFQTKEEDLWSFLRDAYGMELMQFTGLHDKNGKEIYDGDFDKDYQVVMWCENSCGWQWATYDFPTKEKICCHCYNCEGDYNFLEMAVEIIGNIYENTELL